MRLLMLLLFTSFVIAPLQAVSAQTLETCEDFDSQDQSQLVLDAVSAGFEDDVFADIDVEALDPDGDGFACESFDFAANPTREETPESSSEEIPDTIPALDAILRPGGSSASSPVNSRPQPAASVEITDQEEDYLNALNDDMDTVVDVSGELADLFTAAGSDVTLFLDQRWIIDVVAQFVTLQQVGIDAQTLEPSDRQQGIHDVWLEINRLLTLAVDEYIVGIDNLDPASIEQATARFLWAATLTEDLNGAISAFEDDPNTVFEPTHPLYPVETCDPFQDYETAQLYYGANPEEQPTLDPDFDGMACEVFFDRE